MDIVLKGNTVLITGGSSGIGLELSKRLIEQGNEVLICGRSKEKLDDAELDLPAVKTFKCDLSDVNDCRKLADWVKDNYPSCNILINNAAIVHRIPFDQDPKAVEHAVAEVQTNLIAPIALTKYLLPVLSSNKSPEIINITTGLVYAPKVAYPYYNATKAALHSFTQTLRMQLKDSPVKVREVLFPVVNTPWHKGAVPEMAISVQEAVTGMLKGLKKGKKEVKVGKVKLLEIISRIWPGGAMRIINRT